MLIATVHVLAALAHQSLGETEESEKSLQKAEEIFDPNSQASFEAKLTYKLLKCEYETGGVETAK